MTTIWELICSVFDIDPDHYGADRDPTKQSPSAIGIIFSIVSIALILIVIVALIHAIMN